VSSGDGTSLAPFKTITEGINAASAGDTINVAAGTYQERLVINKQLTLTGDGWDSTIVQPTDTPTAGVYDVEIRAGGTIIEQFRFDFNGSGDTRSGNGIVVSDLNQPPVINVQIRNNKIYTGDANTGIQTGKYSDVSGLIVSGNIFYGDPDGMGEGIYVNPYSGSGKVTIQSNQFYGYLYSGVSIEAGNVDVIGNIINSDVLKGIYGVRFIELTGGMAFNNVLISNNDIRNVQYGISAGTSTDVGSTLTATIRSNILTNNDVGIRVRYGAELTITNNNISGNTQYGINNETTTLVIAENNWWGDGSGPYHPVTNPTGLGNAVSDNVDYDPWIASTQADFTASPTAGVAPLTVTFTDASTGLIDTWSWDFDNDSVIDSTAQNPTYMYSASGTYTVSLTVSGPYGTDTQTKTNYITVYAAPVANFSGTPVSGTAPLAVSFTDTSTGNITSWSWDFGDTGTSTLQNPSHTYTSAGTYTVSLTVTGPGGSDTKTATNYITVYAVPVANFSGTPVSGTAPLSVTFTDTSTGDITSWSWVFGDGYTSTVQNPSHTYLFAGTYTVSLTVTGPGGSNTKTMAGYITVSVPAVKQWVKTYGGPYPDQVYFIQQTSDGGYIAAGETGSFGVSGNDAWLLKLDSGGNVEWQKTYGGTGNDYAYSIQQTQDGGYVVAGERSSSSTSSYAWVLKLDSSGNIQWTNAYGGIGSDYAYSIRQTQDGGYIVAGGTGSFSAGGSDAWVLKLDGSGNIQWAKAFGAIGNDYAYSIQQSQDGGYIVAGGTESFGAGGSDAWVLKLDGSGNVQWAKAYGGISNDYAYSIQQAQDGSYAVAGETESFSAGGSDAWLLKLDGSGNVQWAKAYGGTGNDYAYSIQQTADSGFVIAGETASFGAGSYNAWVLKLDGSGNVQLQKTFGSISDDFARSIQRTSDGGYIVAGGTGSFGAGGIDAWVLKLGGGNSGCNIIGSSSAVANNTIATVTVTTMTGIDTDVSPQMSLTSTVDTNGTVTDVCALVFNNEILPSSYDFGNVQVGSSSTAQTFTITNTGTAYLFIGTISITGTNAAEFSKLNDSCSGQTLAASGSCTFRVILSPVSTGTKSANLSIPSNAPRLDVPLSGTGVVIAISVSPESYNYGNIQVGSSSTAKTFTITSIGTADFVVGTIYLTGANASEFAKLNDNCSGRTLAPSNSCTIQAVFSPTSTGVKTANLSIPSNAPTFYVPLSGASVPTISVSPASYSFGNIQVGSSSAAQTFTITSTGVADLVIGAIALTGANASEFSKLNDNCSGRTIAPSNSCTIQAVFSPTSTGVKTANLSIPSNAPTANVPLIGASVPMVSVSPPNYDFLGVEVGSSSAAQTFIITSTGVADLVIGAIALTGANASEFAKLNDNCSGRTVAPSNSCTIQAVFSPTSTGVKTANLSIPSNAPGSPILVTLSGIGTVPNAVQWAMTYGGIHDDYVYSIQQTSDGGYVMTGGTLSFGIQNWDAWVLKLDANGNVQWQRTYGDTHDDYAYSIQETSDGGYVVAGEMTFVMRGSDLWVMKLDVNGDVEWQNTYGGTNNERANAIRQTSDGGYVVAGETGSFGAGGSDAWILKLDGHGNVQWAKAYGSVNNDYANAIRQTSDGGYVVAGERSPNTSSSSAWIFKLDGNGNMLWQSFGDSYSGYGSAECIQQTSDDGYVVAGWIYHSAGGSDAWVLKLDGNGNTQWAKTYGDAHSINNYNTAYSIRQISDGGYIVAGMTGSFGAGGSDAWVFKLDGNGNVQWQNTYGGTNNERANAIQQTSDGGYVAAGETVSFGAGGSDAWVLKLDAIGQVPGCSAMGTSNAITDNTSAVLAGTTLTGADTNVSPQASAASILDIFAEVTEACPFEEDDPAITYTGNWILRPCPSCSGGALRYSCEAGAKAEFSFDGTGIKWVVAKAKMAGMAKVCKDETVCKTVDLYSGTAEFQKILQKAGFAPGPHTLTIEVLGQKNPSATGYCVDIDAFGVRLDLQ
jgi:parallel beta-helix repeat protein